MAAALNSLPQMFFEAAARGGQSPRYMSKSASGYQTATWAESLAAVEETAAALIEFGISPQDRVAIISGTRHEWTESDIAALSAGAVTIPVYPSNLPAECGYILIDSGARFVFVENRAQADKILKIAAEGVDFDSQHHDVPVDQVVLFEGEREGCLSMAEFRAKGREALALRKAEIEARTAALQRDQLATIVYTSGTTGVPKGVMQSHGNHLAALEAVADLGAIEPGEIDFAFLPLAHSFGRMLGYYALYAATVTAYAGSIDTLLDDLGQVRPQLIPSVPRVYEKIYAAVQEKRAKAGAVAGAIFDCAVRIGSMRASYVNRGEAVPAWLQPLDALAHRLVFGKIHERFGGKVRYLMSGGAPLSPEIAEFFHAVGLVVLEGYGLTETTPILTCNAPGQVRIGTVGRPISKVELRIAEDGEILAKGPNIASGYYKKEAETAAAWDAEGWFHTGDIGQLEDGFLRITDRKKELIKTAGGKYVAPQKIENMLKARPLISQAVVVGDRLKYCVALITVEDDTALAFAHDQGLSASSAQDVIASPELNKAVEAEIQAVNRELASFESIKYFRILPRDFSIESGELTASLKVKRKFVAEKYADLIKEMF